MLSSRERKRDSLKHITNTKKVKSRQLSIDMDKQQRRIDREVSLERRRGSSLPDDVISDIMNENNEVENTPPLVLPNDKKEGKKSRHEKLEEWRLDREAKKSLQRKEPKPFVFSLSASRVPVLNPRRPAIKEISCQLTKSRKLAASTEMDGVIAAESRSRDSAKRAVASSINATAISASKRERVQTSPTSSNCDTSSCYVQLGGVLFDERQAVLQRLPNAVVEELPENSAKKCDTDGCLGDSDTSKEQHPDRDDKDCRQTSTTSSKSTGELEAKPSDNRGRSSTTSSNISGADIGSEIVSVEESLSTIKTASLCSNQLEEICTATPSNSKMEVVDISDVTDMMADTCINNNATVSADFVEKDGHYYKSIMEATKKQLEDLGDKWEIVLHEQGETLPDDAQGQILSAIGQAKLLVTKRFKQYAGLCDASHDSSAVLVTRASDLEGFWDVIYFQVEDVFKKFQLLSDLQEYGWDEDKLRTAKNPVAVRSTNPSSKKKKSTKAKESTAKVEARRRIAAFKKAAQAKKAATSSEDTTSSELGSTVVSNIGASNGRISPAKLPGSVMVMTPRRGRRSTGGSSVVTFTPMRRSTRLMDAVAPAEDLIFDENEEIVFQPNKAMCGSEFVPYNPVRRQPSVASVIAAEARSLITNVGETGTPISNLDDLVCRGVAVTPAATVLSDLYGCSARKNNGWDDKENREEDLISFSPLITSQQVEHLRRSHSVNKNASSSLRRSSRLAESSISAPTPRMRQLNLTDEI